ncbi:MAG: SPASM domain-containing protein [Chitinophagales bacterium]
MTSYNFTDTFNFLSKLTFKRIWNGLKILSSFYYSKWKQEAHQWGLPFTVSFEPTTSCNLRCPECPSGLRSFTRPTGMLRKDFFRDSIEELSDHLVYLYFYFQGEPYLNPDFLEMVKFASKKGIYTVTSTNAHFLNDVNAKRTIEAGLDRIIISIDGTTQETYQSYRVGGKLSKVLEGTKNLVRWKKELKSKTPHIIFQFLVVRPNEHQLEEVLQLGKEIGVDKVVFKTAQVYEYENGNPLIPTIDKYARYSKQADGTYTIKNKMMNHCWKLWHSCVITWDGKIVPCCFDKDASHQLGDLKFESFKEVWQGEPYNRFRRALLKSRKEIDICANCSEGTKVWA